MRLLALIRFLLFAVPIWCMVALKMLLLRVSRCFSLTFGLESATCTRMLIRHAVEYQLASICCLLRCVCARVCRHDYAVCTRRHTTGTRC